MNKEQLSQLVQDVIEGKESAINANDILRDIKAHINKCQKEIEGMVRIEMKTPEEECDATESDIY